jgi:hypothetical protein
MINKVVAFGCSFVIGDSMGHRFRRVPYTEKPLAIYYLGKELGLDRDMCDIRAMGGHSNQYIYREFYNYIADVEKQKSLDETLFVFGWTEKSRWEFYSDVEKIWIPISPGTFDQILSSVPMDTDDITGKSYEKLVKEYYKVSFNLKKHFEKSIREIISVQNICKIKKLQYIMFDSIGSVFNEYPKNKLVKLLDKKNWVNYDGNYGDWATMNTKNPKEYTADDAHPSALSQRVWGEYLISTVKSLGEIK